MSKLLLVDDEPNVRYSLEKALKSQDLEILLAGSAKEGIEQVRHARPDAVVLDVRLPDMSGLDAYQVIRQVDPRLPVIVITAFSTTNTAIEAMKMGAFEYLLKPLELDHLTDLVDRAFEIGRLMRVPATIPGGDEPGIG